MCDGFGLTKMCLSHEENSSVSVEVEGGAVRWHSRTASGAGDASGMRRRGSRVYPNIFTSYENHSTSISTPCKLKVGCWVGSGTARDRNRTPMINRPRHGSDDQDYVIRKICHVAVVGILKIGYSVYKL
jgi:hypothetical protein